MPRRSKFAIAAEEWLILNGAGPVTTKELWEGLRRDRPDLTTPSQSRRTPRATCMRDLRCDQHFEVKGGRVELVPPIPPGVRATR